jgi:ParB family chromosome partitioning protein
MELLALDKIIVTNPYLRTDTDIDSLIKSIDTVGLINPLTVNDKNELLAGGRRYQALKELGYKEAPIQRVSLSALEQELVSIDENLVRCPLSKLELEECLNRGREIYEKINPSANKIDAKAKLLTAAEKKNEKEAEESDTTSFAAVTSEKIGLSKSVIKNAIRRDAQSSDTVKMARAHGDLSASQVNELIKLDKKEQDALLPYVKEKSVKNVRKIVDQAREVGVTQAIQDSAESQGLPREFMQLENIVKRTNKQLSKIIIENIDVGGEDLLNIISHVETLNKQTSDFLELYSEGSSSFIPDETNDFESSAVQ